MDLGPASQARFHVVTVSIVANHFVIIVVMGERVRAWADQRHVTAKDSPELRQLIDARLAQSFSDPGYARVVARALLNAIAVLQRCHTAKLQDVELLDIEAATSLSEDDATR